VLPDIFTPSLLKAVNFFTGKDVIYPIFGLLNLRAIKNIPDMLFSYDLKINRGLN